MFEKAMTMTASPVSIDDLTLAKRVYCVLEKTMPPRVSALPIHVQASNGTVILRGVVATNLCRAQILHAVLGVSGVKQVVDQLWV